VNSSKQLKGPNYNNLISKINLFSNLCISLPHKPCIHHNTLATMTQVILILELLKRNLIISMNFILKENENLLKCSYNILLSKWDLQNKLII